MSHTLIVLRHAKSDWPAGVADHRRPLSERGTADAAAAGRWLVDHDAVPQLAVVSPAQRTRRTWELAAGALPAPVPVHFDDAVYEADWTDLLEVVRTLPEDVEVATMVGHNPGSEELATRLAGRGSDAEALARMAIKYPTAGLAVLDVDETWAQVEPGSARMRNFAVPRG